MNILLLEPFYGGSHAAWIEGYRKNSSHRIILLTMPGRFWKWRMAGGALHLAEMFLAMKFRPDLVLATDMIDLATFLALTRKRSASIPTAIYFHENQLVYPPGPDLSEQEKTRDLHYGLINLKSALAADLVLFNSDFHRRVFFAAIDRTLVRLPDFTDCYRAELLREKSEVLPIGIDLKRFDRSIADKPPSFHKTPLILWNHRWEHDKNPEEFFAALALLQLRQVDFRLAILGQSFERQPAIFEEALITFADRIIHFGFTESADDYAGLLCRCDLAPVTSLQEYFGISFIEAGYCGAVPILPNRLSYPEIIPRSIFPELYYEDFSGLVTALTEYCLDSTFPRRRELHELLLGYDWSIMAPIYDMRFERFVSEFRPG